MELSNGDYLDMLRQWKSIDKAVRGTYDPSLPRHAKIRKLMDKAMLVVKLLYKVAKALKSQRKWNKKYAASLYFHWRHLFPDDAFRLQMTPSNKPCFLMLKLVQQARSGDPTNYHQETPPLPFQKPRTKVDNGIIKLDKHRAIKKEWEEVYNMAVARAVPKSWY
ncbi:unnamed protein product [Cylindrotheca closterium]|uniref:Uncharacterized protein n=1 Tax=Cylindrotheca closterium TaxID=2856 RepID=A0AAD2CUZ7_9STRA|nr:unnamed protein product [Cylindrotheca closterium]